MKKITFVFTFACLMSLASLANVRLPNIIGSHMVLQKNNAVKLWGWAAPSEKITIKVSWDTTTYTTKASSGTKWLTEIKTPDAGGPFTIIIEGKNKIILEDVMIGEVWLCGGQSKMEWSADQGLLQSKEEAPNATNNKIRFFYVPKSTSNFPQENVEAKWVVCSPEEMIHFSAIGYFFGKNLNQQLNSPVGLINSNWGGTAAEIWTPAYVIEKSGLLKKAADSLKPSPWWPEKSATAYNSMIYPLTQFSITGVIWYQGESNTSTHYAYEKLFTSMIDSWRRQWSRNFPFYFVQIAPYKYGNYNVGALLREAQTKAANHEKTGMIVITDLVPDTTNIHPILKKEVADRLTNLVLSDTYGFNIKDVQSPTFQSYSIEKNKIRIEFYNAENGLKYTGSSITSFEICGEDQQFYPAQASIEGNTIVVSNTTIKNPIAVRFAFNNTALPNLFNSAGLPVNLFRTDEWKLDTSPIK